MTNKRDAITTSSAATSTIEPFSPAEKAAWPRPATSVPLAGCSEDVQAQPLGRERGLRLVLDLDRDVELQQELPRLTLGHFREHGRAPDPLADPHGRREAHLVEPVVQEHLRALDPRHEVEAER